LTTLVEMDEVVRLRASFKELKLASGVTYNHIVLKAVAEALVAWPAVNARFAGDAIEVVGEVNLGIVTVVEDGLVVPVLRAANHLTLFEIAAAARVLGDKAARGGFSSADLSGGTFTVSNLGMFDVEQFSAVINPPQAAVLAVGSVKERPVVRSGRLEVGHNMYVTLSCDHRAIDGALASRFLADLKRRLEHPVGLLVPAGGG
jgi:pyruvate dehydrogenase E2 component (dihydrolipoamide acetyltransferase)